MTDQVRPHSTPAKVAHWGFIVVFVYALTKQLDEVEELEDLALLQYEMIFATVFLLLLVTRFVYMQFTRPTVLPSTTPASQRLMARAVHIGMYSCLTGVAVTGLIIGGLYGSGTKSGGAMEILLVLHEVCINTCYLLIALHIAAAIYHRRQADGIWDAMVPFWQEQRQDSEQGVRNQIDSES